MKSSLGPLQTAIYQRLSTNAQITAAATGVFDYVPNGQPFPYITIGEDTAHAWYTKTFDGQQVTHTLHTWSQAQGFKEIKNLHNLIVQSVSSSALVVTGYAVAFQRVDFEETMRDPDGFTRHGVIRLRFMLAEL